MRSNSLLAIALFYLFLFSACTAQPTPVYVAEGAERDIITADSDIFIQDIIKGIANQDYATFSADFDDVMLASIKTSDFEQMYAIYGPLGEASSVELLNVQVVDQYYAVRYTVTYPKKEIVIRVVVDGNDPRKVSGLWFE